MSSLTQGWSGLMLAYATVEVPMAATLIRRGVEFGRVFASAALAVPLTIAAGIGTAAVNPLLHDLGISSGSFLEFAVGVGISAGVGYAAARGLARPAKPATVHQRGTIIDDAEPGSRLAQPQATAQAEVHVDLRAHVLADVRHDPQRRPRGRAASQRRHRARLWWVVDLDNVVLPQKRVRQQGRRRTPAMAIGVAGQVWSDQDSLWYPVHPDPLGRQLMQQRVKERLIPALQAG